MRPVLFALLVAGCGAFAQTHQGRPSFGRVADTFPPPNRIAAGPGHILAPPPASHPRHGRTVIVPYPVFYGGYYGYEPPPPAYAQPGAGYYGDPGYAEPAQSPIVIINQNYRPDTPNPVLRDYSNTPLPEPTLKKYEAPSHPYEDQAAVVNDDQPTIYLIAMKDHTIFPALAYWVDGDTLNYITTEGSHNRASLALVDRAFSKQLNDERNVEFRLPKDR